MAEEKKMCYNQKITVGIGEVACLLQLKVGWTPSPWPILWYIHNFTGKAGILTLVLGGLNVGFAVTFISGGRFGLAGMFVAFAILVLAGIPYLIRKKVMNQVEASEAAAGADPVYL